MSANDIDHRICDDFEMPQTFAPVPVPPDIQAANAMCKAWKSERWDAIAYAVDRKVANIEQVDGRLITTVKDTNKSYATVAFRFREEAFHLNEGEGLHIVFEANLHFLPGNNRTWVDVFVVPAGERLLRPQSQKAIAGVTPSERAMCVSIYSHAVKGIVWEPGYKEDSPRPADRSKVNGKVPDFERMRAFHLIVLPDVILAQEDEHHYRPVELPRRADWFSEGVDIWFGHDRYHSGAIPNKDYFPPPHHTHRVMWDNIGCFTGPTRETA